MVVVSQSALRSESYLHRGEEEEGEAAAFLSHGCSLTELLNCGNSRGESWWASLEAGCPLHDPISSLIWAHWGFSFPFLPFSMTGEGPANEQQVAVKR